MDSENIELIILGLCMGVIGIFFINFASSLVIKYKFLYLLDFSDIFGSSIDFMEHMCFIKFNLSFVVSSYFFLILKILFLKFLIIQDNSLLFSQIDHLASIFTYLANYNPRGSGILTVEQLYEQQRLHFDAINDINLLSTIQKLHSCMDSQLQAHNKYVFSTLHESLIWIKKDYRSEHDFMRLFVELLSQNSLSEDECNEIFHEIRKSRGFRKIFFKPIFIWK